MGPMRLGEKKQTKKRERGGENRKGAGSVVLLGPKWPAPLVPFLFFYFCFLLLKKYK